MKQLKLLFTVLFLTILGLGNVWAENVTTTLTQSEIYGNGTGAGTGYTNVSITNSDGFEFDAYAIRNFHSKATNTQYFLQIKKYASSVAYYVSIPEMPGTIQSISMTVSGSSQPMSGGGNTATLYFSASNSTSTAGDGVASGTGASTVTIDASDLELKEGYITASGAVRIWNIEVTYASSTGSTETTVLLAPKRRVT